MTLQSDANQASDPHGAEPLGIEGFSWADLHRAERLADLHATFLARLRERDADLADRWDAHAAGTAQLEEDVESRLMIEVAGHVSWFLGELFRIHPAQDARRAEIERRSQVYRITKPFLKKHKARAKAADADAADVRARAAALLEALPGIPGVEQNEEERFAGRVLLLLERKGDEPAFEGSELTVDDALALLALDLKCREVAEDPALAEWHSLRNLEKMDFEAGLVEAERPDAEMPDAIVGPLETRRRRDGFKLTDARATTQEVLDEVDQCLFCHATEKDSCHKGLFDKKSGEVKKNPLGIPLEGCPLDERISEMHELYGAGDPIAALAMVMVDNPMCPGTGHRICNDCMKSCVFQNPGAGERAARWRRASSTDVPRPAVRATRSVRRC